MKLKNALNEAKQYSRRANVKVINVPELHGETDAQLHEMLTQTIGKTYGVPLRDDDIEVCHRVGKQKRNDNPRPVIVKFLRRGTKDALFRKLKTLRPQGPRIYHDLTHINSRLLYDLRQCERIDSAWISYSGHVIAKGVNGGLFKVDMLSDIETELATYNK